jgi:hypothetical protein
LEDLRDFDAFGFIESGLIATPDAGACFAVIIATEIRAEAGAVAPMKVDATIEAANRDFVIIGIPLFRAADNPSGVRRTYDAPKTLYVNDVTCVRRRWNIQSI